MSRYLRYLLIWLSCTAVSVTAVILTVRYVVGSTKATPPVARSAPTVFGAPSADAGRHSAAASPSPSPDPSTPSPTPSPTLAPPTSIRPPSPKPSKTATPSPSRRTGSTTGDYDDCTGGSGVHTINSSGGQASVRFGDNGVCLVSAVPTRGFTVRTRQTEPTTLSVTFSGDRQQSVITATTEPEDRATVRESSW